MKQILKNPETLQDRQSLMLLRDELLRGLLKRTEAYEKDMYADLNRFYQIQLKLYPFYGFRTLAIDTQMAYPTVCKILGWRHATTKLKRYVEKGVLSKNKALTIIAYAKKNQDKVAKEVINNNLSEREMRMYIIKGDITATAIKKGEKIKSNDLVFKMILLHVDRLERPLGQINRVPSMHVNECKERLVRHKKQIEKALEVL